MCLFEKHSDGGEGHNIDALLHRLRRLLRSQVRSSRALLALLAGSAGYATPRGLCRGLCDPRQFGRDRKGEQCRVIARGAMNSALIEFDDGYRVVTGRNGLRRTTTA